MAQESFEHERLAGPIVSNPRSERVREFAKLARRSARSKAGKFLVEGPQAVREALLLHGAGRSERTLIKAAWMTAAAAERHPDLLDSAAIAGVEFRQITDEALSVLTETVAAQGVVIACEFIDVRLDDVIAQQPKLVAVLAHVRDPGNAGTVLRAADAAGADAVVLTDASVDVYNPKTVRSTAGSLFHLPVVTNIALSAAVEQLQAADIRVLAADGHEPALDLHTLPCDGVSLADPTAWVFGNEAWGLPPEDRELADAIVKVPMYGAAESLNLAVAASLCLYESARAQRG
ncbi:RNA methyltransferase [Saxibacter everestensis]|uniref:RNA methyltransferase n=1 Tax=Saxibacter everestensis TaxID=2909229 RepID=A0ABY8QVU1_9MICO|nr:RNA methyltransferase [Brevibacteriaceae bacterium ZFBP1038]